MRELGRQRGGGEAKAELSLGARGAPSLGCLRASEWHPQLTPGERAPQRTCVPAGFRSRRETYAGARPAERGGRGKSRTFTGGKGRALPWVPTCKRVASAADTR